MSLVSKVSSNLTTTRVCPETTLGVLPAAASQVWTELEINSYSDFGGKATLVPRAPIMADRQRRKGVVSDLDASCGYNLDMTQNNLQTLLTSFMFAALREKTKWTTTVSAVAAADDSYASTAVAAAFKVNELVLASGFTLPANNGLKVVANVSTSGKLIVGDGLENETPAATGTALTRVGFQFTAGDAAITNSGTSFPTMTASSKNLTELGIVPGEWVFIGGDSAGTKFATAANNGFARVRSVTTTTMTFDKTANVMVTEAGGSLTVQIFTGRVLKNETGTSLVRKSFTHERELAYSNDTDATKLQAEYIPGCVGNTFTLSFKPADKLTADLSFVGLTQYTLDENDSVTLLSKVAGATKVSALGEDGFNMSSDVTRTKLAAVSTSNACPSGMLSYMKEFTITGNNNVKPDKAVGVLGAFDMSVGTCEIGGSISGYYNQTDAVAAVMNGSDVTFDIQVYRDNAGFAIDIPLIGLDNGRLQVAKDEEVVIPLDMPASIGTSVASTYTHTLLMVFFDYLPALAS